MKMHLNALALCGLCLAMPAGASEVSVPNEFQAGTAAIAAEVNANFQALETGVNDNHQRITTLESAGGDLTVVQYLSWQHDGNLGLGTVLSDGLALWFTDQVQVQDGLMATADTNLVLELYQLSSGAWVKFSDLAFTPLQDVTVTGDDVIESYTLDNSTPTLAQGVRLLPGNSLTPGFYKLVLRGDFVLDSTDRALDADFLGASLPSGDRIAGGTFESWFTIDP